MVRIREGRVEASLPYLLQFLAGTRLWLAVYFDIVRYSRLEKELLGDETEIARRDEAGRFDFGVYESHISGYASVSRLLGKVLIKPPPVEEAGIWPYERPNDQDVEFIIGLDAQGKAISSSSNPNGLGNYFGANPDAPDYLTPVYFRREVLSKYYADPDRYEVSDSSLRCLGLWVLRMDNNHSTHVVVFLGDLGRDLPYHERLHWKQFNVQPEGGVSEVYFRRSFLAQFADPEAPDLVFRQKYRELNGSWEEKLGWPLFLPLEEGDSHLERTVRVPVTTSQAELDEQVLTLTKLLVDSLNEGALVKALGSSEENEKGISKLERFLTATGFPEVDVAIGFLRDLQDLRSRGSGHRKGSGYDKLLLHLGLKTTPTPEVMVVLLQRAVVLLGALQNHYCDGEAAG